MKTGKKKLLDVCCLLTIGCAMSMTQETFACTRILYVGEQNMVATGRNMDWNEDMMSNLWIFPRGIQRNGLAGPSSMQWRSRYGSVVVSGYEAGSTDGMNEKGLVANLLFLAESDYGQPVSGESVLSLSLWLQYFLDLYATVDEAVHAQRAKPLRLIPSPAVAGGAQPKLHLSISDATGDSAILEYIDGELVIHHGRNDTVMTNSPVYSQQKAINAYWKEVGGTALLPGTIRSAAPVRACIVFSGSHSQKTGAGVYARCPGAAVRLSGRCRSHERGSCRQCTARYQHAGQTQYRIDDMADGIRPEKQNLLFRFRDTSQYFLGRFRQA